MGFKLPVYQYQEELDTIQCGQCAIIFAVPADWKRNRIEERGKYYCPNGHCRVYIGETKAEKLQRELDQLQSEKARAIQRMWEAQAGQRKAEAKAQKLAKRASAGVCPCCNRTVSQMARHMKSKHPDWKS